MAKTAGQKTKVYSKYGKEIYVLAKNGGVDPDGVTKALALATAWSLLIA